MPNINQKFFKAFRKNTLQHISGGRYTMVEGPGHFITDLRSSIDRCFLGVDGINAGITNCMRWLNIGRWEAEQHFEVVEYELVEVKRYSISEAKALKSQGGFKNAEII